MRAIKNLAIIVVVVLMTSCTNAVKFPVSNTVPGADITVTKKQDKNKNYVIEVTAENLAEASRLNALNTNYSVWIVDENGAIKNVGQLITKDSKKTTLKTTTPYNAKEIFITAEEQGNLSYPQGTEISRITFEK